MDQLEQVEQLQQAQDQAPVEQSKPVQTFTQEQVNKIAASRAARAAETARQEAEARYRSELENLQALQQKKLEQEQRNEQVPRDIDVDAIYRQVQEKAELDRQRMQRELEERQLREHMAQVANAYESKVELAKSKYADFEEVVKDFEPKEFPNLVYLLAGVDNAGDVLYDLAKNEQKLAQLNSLALTSPKMAQKALLKLSQSITQNQQALANAQAQTVLDPLDRLQPSKVSGDNQKMTVRDLRSQPWLRG